MQTNGIRVFAVTKGEIVPLWQYHAEHEDGRTRSLQVEPSDDRPDEVALFTLEEMFRDDD